METINKLSYYIKVPMSMWMVVKYYTVIHCNWSGIGAI